MIQEKSCFQVCNKKCKVTLAVLATLLAIPMPDEAYADGTVTIGTSTVVDFKGWGIFPANYDRQIPTYGNGDTAWPEATWLPGSGTVSTSNPTYLLLKDLQFNIAKVALTPTLCRSDNTLDPARMQDLKDHLQTMQNMGVTKYFVTLGTPPAHMKTPDRVRYGEYNNRSQTLDPAYADGIGFDFADYFVAVLSNLRAAGLPSPVGVSIQNEPDVSNIGDTCTYSNSLWRTVVKQVRAKMNSANFQSVPITGSESTGIDNLEYFLGTPSSSGFSAMNSDTALRDAIGGFSYHMYYTSAKIRTMTQAMSAYPGRDRWMTEYSGGGGIVQQKRPYDTYDSSGSGNQELNWALNNVRRMAADMVDFKTNYWFWWNGWNLSSTPGYQSLIYGTDSQRYTTKAYHVFKRLWNTVKPGWKVKQTTTTEPDLSTDNSTIISGFEPNGNMMSQPVDILTFESADATQNLVMLCNWKNQTKNITALTGLRGANAKIYQTTTANDMSLVSTRNIFNGALQGGNLTLPGWSITFVVSSGTQGPNLVANPSFDAENYDTQNPSGWSEWSDRAGVNSSYTETTGGSASGSRHLTHWNNVAYRIYTYQRKTGLQNGLYTLRCKARRSGGQIACQLEAKEYGGSLRSATLPVSNNYENVEIKDINVTNGQAMIGIWSDGYSGNWAAIDDVEFFKQ
jgi:hypothetical protein